MTLETLKGVGPGRLKRLQAEGIHTLSDLVNHLPKRYDVRSIASLDSIENGASAYLKGTIERQASVFFIRKNLSRLTFKARIEGRLFTVAIFNQHYLKKTLNPGDHVALYAKIEKNKTTLTAQKVIKLDHFKEGITPVYGIAGIGDAIVQQLMRQTFDHLKIPDFVPYYILESYGFPTKHQALKETHFPSSMPALRKALSRIRYETLLIYQLRVLDAKMRRHHQKGASKTIPDDAFVKALKHLPFTLSDTQKAAVRAIGEDLESPSPMRRMLQGDTGSGKTVVALLAAFAVLQSGYQAAFMAPTEILARQQFEDAKNLFEPLGMTVCLLTQGHDDEQEILKTLRDGTCDLVVGTHRLFSRDVVYHRLGLVITDEQHRFGVEQRKRLSTKGEVPDILYLSATPIPRTLAMTLFGDMDISTIDRPQGKADSVVTAVRTMKSENAAMKAVKRRLEAGEQVYIVAPTIEEQQTLTGVKALYKHYKQAFSDYAVGQLHGRMNSADKTKTLNAFKTKKTDVLITTTVIEVGIHAPNATLIVIYHGERFGYAQLHQLRGRVGREDKEGACVILAKDDEAVMKRLKILETTHDGFELSDIDLKRRGFGDLVGTQQSGRLDILKSEEEGDFALFEQARLDAEVIMDQSVDEIRPELLHLFNHIQNEFSKDESVENHDPKPFSSML